MVDRETIDGLGTPIVAPIAGDEVHESIGVEVGGGEALPPSGEVVEARVVGRGEGTAVIAPETHGAGFRRGHEVGVSVEVDVREAVLLLEHREQLLALLGARDTVSECHHRRGGGQRLDQILADLDLELIRELAQHLRPKVTEFRPHPTQRHCPSRISLIRYLGCQPAAANPAAARP